MLLSLVAGEAMLRRQRRALLSPCRLCGGAWAVLPTAVLGQGGGWCGGVGVWYSMVLYGSLCYVWYGRGVVPHMAPRDSPPYTVNTCIVTA